MTKQQLESILTRLTPIPSVVPPSYYVAVMLTNGAVFDGIGFVVEADNMIQVSIPRIAEAHLSKPPVTALVDIAAIAAITTNNEPTPA